MPVLTQVRDASLVRKAITNARASHKDYCAHALRIRTEDEGVQPFDWNRAQDLISSRIEAQWDEQGRIRVIVLKRRQLGVSTFFTSRLFWKTTLWEGLRGAVVADKVERSETVFGMLDRYNEHVPDALVPSQVKAQRTKELAWSTDSSLIVDTAGDPNVLRSSTTQLLLATELAFWPHPEESYASAVGSIPEYGSEIYVESTANGIGNLFWRMWTGAVSGENGFLPIFLPWWWDPRAVWPCSLDEAAAIRDSGDKVERQAQDEGYEWEGQTWKLSPEQLMWRRRTIMDRYDGNIRTFRQEMPATAEEAFLVSGEAFFDEDRLSELETSTRKTVVLRRSLRRNAHGQRIFVPVERGSLRVVELPADAHYVIGADTATGEEAAAGAEGLSEEAAERGGRDYNAAQVIKIADWKRIDGKWTEVPTRKQVAELHLHCDPDEFADWLYALGIAYSCRVQMVGGDTGREPCLVIPERNHWTGMLVIRRLIDLGYPNLFRRRVETQVRGKRPKLEYGWLSDHASRNLVLDAFGAMVREGTSGVMVPDTVREMRTFVQGKDGKYQAQEGLHDDRVLSYAIALEGERFHRHGAIQSAVQTRRRPTPTGR